MPHRSPPNLLRRTPSERGLASGFLKPTEFEAAVGDPLDPAGPRHLDDPAFVAALCGTVLDRPSDAGGRDFRLSVLARPDVDLDRADLLRDFAACRENVEGPPAMATLAGACPASGISSPDAPRPVPSLRIGNGPAPVVGALL